MLSPGLCAGPAVFSLYRSMSVIAPLLSSQLSRYAGFLFESRCPLSAKPRRFTLHESRMQLGVIYFTAEDLEVISVQPTLPLCFTAIYTSYFSALSCPHLYR